MRILAFVLTLFMLAGMLSVTVSAVDDPDNEPEVPTIVYVTIATIGSWDLKQEPIRVVDIDA
ncbi:MAG: hypothetical protein J6L85_02745, partial [Clostridia bacterium]|nr:hypothetical protein [Clostridia bacterium]